MSCKYRSYCYRTAVSIGRSDHLVDWVPDPHPTVLPSLDVPKDDLCNRVTVTKDTWHRVMEKLSSATDVEHRQAVQSILHLGTSHGWQHLPPLPDRFMPTVWTTLLSMVLPHRRTAGMDRLFLSLGIGDLTRMLFVNAPEDRRSWLWETFRDRVMRSGRTVKRVLATIEALRWHIPLWMIPQSIDDFQNDLRIEPLTGITALRSCLTAWMDDLVPDPQVCAGIRSLLHAMVATTKPWQYDTDTIDSWFTIIRLALHIDPTIGESVPSLLDSISKLCTHHDFVTVDQAIQMLDALKPFNHPTFRSVINQVWQQGGVSVAATWLLEYLIHRRKIEEARALVEQACQTVLDSPSDPPHGAVATVAAAMRIEETAPALLPYLHRLFTTNSPRSFEHAAYLWELARTSYPMVLAGAMFTIADRILQDSDDVSLAVIMLSRAWDRGSIFHQRIIDIVLAHAHRDSLVHELKTIILPGVYSCTHGKQVVDLITNFAPEWPEGSILAAIGEYYRPGRPIPKDIQPVVLQACLHNPGDVDDKVLFALWESDPSAAVRVATTLIANGSPWPVAQLVQKAWKHGGDDQIAVLVDRMHRYWQGKYGIDEEYEEDEAMIRAITTGIWNGVGVGDPRVVVHVWQRFLASVPPSRLREVVDLIGRAVRTVSRELWAHGDPLTVITMLQILYTRCADADLEPSTMVSTVRSILHTLSYGWGKEADWSVWAMLDTTIHHAVQLGLPYVDLRDVIVEGMQAMRHGWGRGLDRHIGNRLLTIMAWLDREEQGWEQTPIGAAVMEVFRAGGYDPSGMIVTDDRFGGRGVDRQVLIQARNTLARQLGLPTGDDL